MVAEHGAGKANPNRERAHGEFASLEVIVADGMSTDGTWFILSAYAEAYCVLKLLRNEREITPVSLNMGIAASSGEIICRVDAHARVAPDYLRRCVETLLASSAASVGGAMRTLPSNSSLSARSIALCMSHPLGAGTSEFRTCTGTEPVFTDTVFGGCFRKKLFDRIGMFNESLPRSQDMEFSQRIHTSGGKILLDPAIKCDYFACADLRTFARHNLEDGRWSILPFARTEIVPVRWRHIVPLFCLGLSLLLALCGIWLSLPRFAIITLAGCYFAASVGFSVKLACDKRNYAYFFTMPVVFAIRHFGYGVGSLYGAIQLLWQVLSRRVSFRTIIFKRSPQNRLAD